MHKNESYYDQLIQKIDSFTRKYYLNQFLRGLIWFTGMLTAVFIAFNLLESWFYFSKSVRKVLFYSFIGIGFGTFYYWMIRPLMHYFRLGKLISHEEASKIIGTHFKDVQDKLLNLLQLKSQSVQFSDRSLIEASIHQKAMELHPVPFVKAIDLNKNRKYLRYAILPLFFLISILLLAPSLIKDSSKRLIKNDLDFAKEAPFQFVIQNENLEVLQNENFDLRIKVEGKYLPSETYIEIDHFKYRLRKETQDTYVYTFSNVQKKTDFILYSGDVISDAHQLDVILKPQITEFDTRLEYPSYTGRSSETLKNTGGLVVPAGTKISWDFKAENTDELSIRFSNTKLAIPISRRGPSEFFHQMKVLKDQTYTLFLNNKRLPEPDSVQYQISVIPDQHPLIQVESFEDSSNSNLVYYAGELSDDYGLRNLSFNYQKISKTGKLETVKSIPIKIEGSKASTFRHILDVEELQLVPGEKLSYYFEVWDNDGVNGSKSSRSAVMEFNMASKEELAQNETKNNEEIKDNLEDALKEARKLQEKLKEYKDKLRQKKDLEWQNKKDLDKMVEQQQDIQKKWDEAKKKFDENLKKQQQFSEPDEELKAKQENLQKLFEQNAQQEMQQLMNQIQQLMQELNKDQAIQMTEQFEDKGQNMEKQMERLLELFKQLELEKQIKDQINELRDLANKQEELKEKTENKSEQNEDLKKQQEDIQKKFEDLKKKQEEIQEKNKELERPKTIEDQKENAKEAEKNIKDAKEKISNKDNPGAGKEQKKAADKMNEMADQMEQQMQDSEEEEQEEDIKALRQLLENLVVLSYDQENLIKDFEKTPAQTPAYVGLVREQFRLKDNFRLVQDSLEALAKRVVEIESYVTDKVTEINDNFGKTLGFLENRYSQQASAHQGKIMKNVNDLAVMLSETMNDKQQQNNSTCDKPGSKSCKKPGKSKSPKGKKGKVPMDKITQGQQKVGEDLKKMQDQMKKGEGKQMSQEFAQMAAEQAKLRKQLQDLEKEKKEQGQGMSKELQEAIEQMNKNERDLVNKRLNNETLKRQQEITTRLLEAERAEREREYKEERKSETGTKIERKLPAGLEEYIKQRQAETEWFQYISPDLRPYYKKMVEEYFNKSRKQG